jgi:hypothetical protein
MLDADASTVSESCGQKGGQVISFLIAASSLALGIWLGRFTKAEYRYNEGLRRGIELGKMETLLRLTEDDPEMCEFIAAECKRLNEVEALERMAKAE